MPDLLTPQALATAGPLILETLFKHFFNPRAGAKKHNEARQEDLMYDEAFILMKTFLETATRYPVSGLQRFGLVRTPAPPWVGIHRICIPQRTLVHAADYLIQALGGEEMAYKVAGGTKWWQVRAGPGVEAEWIVLKKDWKDYQRSKEKEREQEELEQRRADDGMVGDDGGVDGSGHFRKEMDELRCMLYIHGGAYYWGSINTHRYTIWRYARKMHGRCFAVNYRKAPQYPFPCAIQDCLAAYLYLTRPPPEAKHKPVDPKNLVLAGDSAGGGLVLALLQILRDTEGLTLPAGAVLISPWSDLTHSFPSILQNTATDIVPPFGFIHKPSSLWPPPPPQLTEVMQTGIRSRVKEVVHQLKPSRDEDGHRRPRSYSVLHRNDPKEAEELEKAFENRQTQRDDQNRLKLNTAHPQKGVGRQGSSETLHPSGERGDLEHHPHPQGETDSPQSRANPGLIFGTLEKRDKDRTDNKASTTLAQCDTPLELVAKDEKVVVDTQIQLYATNAQLCHPWVSPILGYLGGLPPLLVCAGDHEVLRDEITYLAHKAADPDAYPIRDDVRAQLPSLQGIESKYGPTNVHFQIYDGTCHDLPLFSMTTPARGMFRAIASFARFCTPGAPGSLHINTPSNSRLSGSVHSKTSASSLRAGGSATFLERPVTDAPQVLSPITGRNDGQRAGSLDIPRTMSPAHSRASSRQSTRIGDQSGNASDADETRSSRSLPRTRPSQGPTGDDAGPRFGAEDASKNSRAKAGEAGHSGIYSGADPFTNHMIRERVSTTGVCRPLEPASELAALNLPQDEVGVIKEGQATRYLNGQHLWDKKFHRAAKQVEKHRRKNLKAAKERDRRKLVTMWEDRIRRKEMERGETDAEGSGWETAGEEANQTDAAAERSVLDQSWSWEWALHGEAPPPSAIVSRRDFSEARHLALMADRMDDEHGAPVGGLSIWVGLATFFSNSQERNRAHEAVKQAREASKTQAQAGGESGTSTPSEKPKSKTSVSRRFGGLFRSRRSRVIETSTTD